jgi:hypothetical protein
VTCRVSLCRFALLAPETQAVAKVDNPPRVRRAVLACRPDSDSPQPITLRENHPPYALTARAIPRLTASSPAFHIWPTVCPVGA